jgi:hypothetical protein
MYLLDAFVNKKKKEITQERPMQKKTIFVAGTNRDHYPGHEWRILA